MVLKEHKYRLTGERVVLRPLAENDWQIIAVWETDLEVVYWADREKQSVES